MPYDFWNEFDPQLRDRSEEDEIDALLAALEEEKAK
jgi:hypothetical protein